MDKRLYSIRMRASKGDIHISGAERIVREEKIKDTVSGLLSRAGNHERGSPDNINITIDSLEGRDILALPPLPVHSLVADTFFDGREKAASELAMAGVSVDAAGSAMDAITSGPAIHGAIIMDSNTGTRLSADDTNKGVRARVVDYDEPSAQAMDRTLELTGLSGSRLKDALALATKVAAAPGTVAELCISDNPDYVTGYVASPGRGYIRITPLKANGDASGGRVFFVDSSRFDIEAYTEYLRETPVLITGGVKIS